MSRQRLTALGKLGLITDPVVTSTPFDAWTNVNNCYFKNGEVRTVSGEFKLFNFAIRPVHSKTFTINGSVNYLLVSDGLFVHAYTFDGLHEDITPTVPFTGGHVSFADLNGVLVVNSASSGAFYWQGPTHKLEILPGWDPAWRCRQLCAYKYYLVALGMTEGTDSYFYKVRWSNSAAEGELPVEWLPTAANDAGDDLLGETSGKIVGACLVRDALWIVKEDAVYAMNWIGGQYVMQITRLKGNIGTRLEHGFAEMQGGVVICTTSDLVFFDGNSSKSIVDGRIRKALFNAISEEYWERTRLFVHQPTSTLYVCGVSADSNNNFSFAFTYDWEQDTWGRRKLNNATSLLTALVSYSSGLQWDQLGTPSSGGSGAFKPGMPWDQQNQGSWNKGVYQPSTPDLLVLESNEADTQWWASLGALVNTDSLGRVKYCAAERVGMAIEGADGVVMLTEVWPEVLGYGTVNFYAGGMDELNSPVRWDGPYQFELGIDNHFCPRVTGRLACIRIESEMDGAWSLAGLTFNWVRAGER
jgi:hypothetical protein